MVRLGMLRARAALAIGAVVASAVVPVTALAAPPSCENRDNNQYRKLLECVSGEGVAEHMAAFQAIAEANLVNGVPTRASTTPGYTASVDYVVDVLEAAGWEVERVPFTYGVGTNSVLEQLTPTAATWPANPAVGTGGGDLTTNVVPVDINLGGDRQNTSGCEMADFAGFPAGALALVQRGTCPFRDKALNAAAAGAGGVIIFNQGDAIGAGDRFGPVSPTLTPTVPGQPVVSIPVVGTSFAAGEALSVPGSTAHVRVVLATSSSENVIAELPGLNASNVVMAGAHLDSVPAGPGINDNGSGSAALLEIAQNLSGHVPQNTVRFAWWGAEELGLIGSSVWVNDQSQQELDRIAMYMNFDMIGSPNYIFMIYDADQSSFPPPAGVPIPAGSAAIEDTFESYFTYAGQPYDDTQFSGRSDYQAFINRGIPSSGLFTGAEVRKTVEQQGIWGGTAGAQFDPCYHAACDTIANYDELALDVNADAIAFAVLTYAYSTEAVNGVPGVRVPGRFTIPEPAGPEFTFVTTDGGDSVEHDDAAAS